MGKSPDAVLVLLTHDHGDHMGDYFDVLKALSVAGLNVKTTGQSDLMRAGLVQKFKDSGLETYLGSTPLSRLSGVYGFKLLLPIDVSFHLAREDREFFERSRLDKQNLIRSLQWTGESLYDVANDRIRACSESNNGSISFQKLFDECMQA